MARPVALSIAGSDPSGGAGLQADLQVFHHHGCHGQAVVTLITVQSSRGVRHMEALAAQLVADQLDEILDDAPPAALKTGALGSRATVEVVAARVVDLTAPLVIDPILLSSSGAPLLSADATAAMRTRLLPCATLVMPNAAEAEALAGRPVDDLSAARDAARAIADLGPRAVLVTGGHLRGEPVDVLWADGELVELSGTRIETRHTHGTGCVYSAAVTARLARGEPLAGAVARAHAFVRAALRSAPGLGHGAGPLDLHAPEDG